MDEFERIRHIKLKIWKWEFFTDNLPGERMPQLKYDFLHYY